MDSFNNIKKIIIKAPSNIALIKYWGKVEGKQIPMNPSLSLTLSKCLTLTEIEISSHQNKILNKFSFEGKENIEFAAKVENYLTKMTADYKIDPSISFNISTRNSFPHSSGIASSASSFASFSVLAFCMVNNRLPVLGNAEDLNNLSSLARQGSGSACRSIKGGVNLWGELNNSSLENPCNEYAIKLESSSIHQSFHGWGNSIIVINSGKKEYGSSLGHQFMQNHFYRDGRIKQAEYNLNKLFNSMRSGDVNTFGQIMENEALSLHSLMLSGDPSFILLKPESLKIIQALYSYRKQTGVQIFFTIDAGPNLHLLYPPHEKENALRFIHQHSDDYEKVIHDEIGSEGLQLEVLSD